MISGIDQNLVEFRCMIQDILGSEVYGDKDDKFRDRTIFYCITIPGENEWVRNSPKGNKNDFMTNDATKILAQENGINDDTAINRLSFSLVNWSYPIPSDGKNRSCLIKVYDIKTAEVLRVNDIVQVSGHIETVQSENLPSRQVLTDESSPNTHNNGTTSAATNASNNNNNINSFGVTVSPELDFEPAIDFPHRLVPRVHVKELKKLNHINPLLSDQLTWDKVNLSSIKLARARLSTILTQLLGGDSLSSEYLILSLISKIHRKKDVSTLGQLTINLTGFKPEMKFLIEKLYEIISKITTHSHYIDMSIANLNNLRFTPKKDHDNNKMIAGTLQLPDGLYLMLNETALSEGQLTTDGTENLGTLNQIIRWQRLNYNFKYHSVEIDTDLKVLVISEGKSVLAVPFRIPIEKNDPEIIDSMRQACESVDDFLTEDLLNMFRYFITALKDVPDYTIPDEVQKCIQMDFITWRRGAEASGKVLFSADDLSSYMTLARYLTISRGETTLTTEIWKGVCQMESTRQSRC